MQISVQSSGEPLSTEQVAQIEKDLSKIARRLNGFNEVYVKVRVSEAARVHGHHVFLELDYGRQHLIAKEEHADLGQAVRAARDDIVRQINDRRPKGHSWFNKRRK